MDLAAIADQLAIGDLIHRYAFNVRSRMPAECRPLFTDDIVFEVRQSDMTDRRSAPLVRSRVERVEAVEAYIARSAGADLSVCPMIHNVLVEVAGDEATGTCLMTSRTWPPGGEVIGQYADRFRRDGGRWRFSERIFTIFVGGQPHA